MYKKLQKGLDRDIKVSYLSILLAEKVAKNRRESKIFIWTKTYTFIFM